MIKYKFIVSGCVDRYSRYIIWLKCAGNNFAKTSYDYFTDVIKIHIPSIKMRGDKGSENRMIAKHMILLRNDSTGGYIGGRLTHNTRIE